MKRTVYVKDELWREARKAAIDLDISTSALVERAITLYLVSVRAKRVVTIRGAEHAERGADPDRTG